MVFRYSLLHAGLALLLFLSAAADAQGPVLRVVEAGTPIETAAPTARVLPGGTIRVQVRVDNPLATGVTAWTLGIRHDSAQLEILSTSQSISDFSDFPPGFPLALGTVRTANLDVGAPGQLNMSGMFVAQVISLSEMFFLFPMSEGVIIEATYRNLSMTPGETTILEFTEQLGDVPSNGPVIPVPVSLALQGGIVFEFADIPTESLTIETVLDGAFVRGSCAGSNGPIGLPDVIALLEFTFGGGSVPCADACDFDDSGQVTFLDAISLLGFLFTGGAPPVEPTGSCGFDPTDDAVECAATPTNCL